MPRCTIASHTLHYRDDGTGTPLVLLHANPGDSRDFDAIAPALARRYRLIRPDWPGYGDSPVPGEPCALGATTLLTLVEGLVETLDLPRFHLLGNSVGGNVAARYALAHPQRLASLILVSPGGFTRHNALTRSFCRLQGITALKPCFGTWFTRYYLQRRNDWTRAMIARAGGCQATVSARAANAAIWRSFLEPAHDLHEAARLLAVPTLLVSGKHDPIIPARSDGRCAALTIPSVKWEVMDCGHAPFAELPDAFLARLNAFLEDGAGLPPE